MAQAGSPLGTEQVFPKFATDYEGYTNPVYDNDESLEATPIHVDDIDNRYPNGPRNSISEESLEYRSTSELSDWSCVYSAARGLVCVTFFTIVLVSMTLYHVCLFSLTSDLHVSEDVGVVFRDAKGEPLLSSPDNPTPSSNNVTVQTGPPSNVKGSSDIHLTTDVKAIWGLFIALCLPYVCTALGCLWKVITMQTEKLKWNVVFKAALPDTIHIVGLNLFLFYVLPSFDPLTGLFLSLFVASCPGLLMIMRHCQKGTQNRFVKCLRQSVYLLLYVACFVMFYSRVVLVRQSLALKILLPISLVLISLSWWDNYVIRRRGTDNRNALENLKFAVGLHRPKFYLVLSIWKIVLSFVLAFGTVSGGDLQCLRTAMMLDDKAYGCTLEGNVMLTNNGDDKWILVFLCFFASGVCYKTVKYACKIQAQVPCVSVPFFLSLFASAGLIFWALLTAKGINTWIGMPVVPDYSLSGIHPFTLLKSYTKIYWFPLLLGGLIYLFAVPGSHIWWPKNEKFARTQSLFRQPLYCSVLLLPSLILNRNREEGMQDKTQPDRTTRRPMIHLCATMWHEETREMRQLIKSIFRLDAEERSAKSRFFDMNTFDFDAHIFFDDAFKNDHAVNRFVKSFGEVFKKAVRVEFKTDLGPPRKYQTPYGGRLDWELPNGHSFHVHLKNNRKIRAKKRWSQVMYMYYLIKYKILTPFGEEEGRQRAANTFILTLDGDVDFQPHAVHTLLDRIKANPEIGSLCGRIHPIGSGPMIWYQKFEYAVSHWLQKAAENMFGCVLCSPGCFSIFRASALMEVMGKYTTPVTSAFQKIQFDLGEDRWLCTLLLQKGYRVEYTAAADSYTFAPEGFVEFFKQRRRWTPSTMANTYDLVRSWRETTDNNPNITLVYIIYQLGLLIASVVTPGTIFMLMVGALSSAFPALSLFLSFILNLLPIVLFVVLNLKSSQNVQAYYAQVLTICYCLLMTVVLVGIIKQAAESGFCSASTLFLTAVTAVFITSAMLHPQEGVLLLFGPLYFLMIPCTSLLMFVYSVANINDTSWGTRDTNIEDDIAPTTGLLDRLPLWIRPCVKCFVPSEELTSPEEESDPLLGDDSPDCGADTELEPYHGESEELERGEADFWERLIEDHLMPDTDTLVNSKMKRDLTTIRNNAFLGFILINAIFIILLFSLESIAQQTSNLAIEIPCTDDKFKPERVQPIAMAFTMVFGVFLVLQWFGMDAHRFSTLLQVVSSSQVMKRKAEPVSESDISRLENAYRKIKAERQFLDVQIEDERQGDRRRRENRMRREQRVDLTVLWGDILDIAVGGYEKYRTVIEDGNKRIQRLMNNYLTNEVKNNKTLKDLPNKAKDIIKKVILDAYTDIKGNNIPVTMFAKSIKNSTDKTNRREHIQKTVRRVMGGRTQVRDVRDVFTRDDQTEDTSL